MAKPKLGLIPAAQGTKFYSVLPSDGTGDFDFTRGSVATRINAQGLIENVASGQSRLDYPMIDGVQKGCPHHILEPASTNLINYSQAISNTLVKNGTFVDNAAISPDGTLNATKLTATTTDPFFYQSITFAAATYTSSIYVKGIGDSIGKEFRIAISSSTTAPKLIVPSEWTRFEFTATVGAGTGSTGIEITDPAIVGDEVLVWGWQVEEQSYATSYIPTTSTAVTRSAETASGAGNSTTFNSEEGVLMAEISALADDLTFRTILLSDGTNSNRIGMFYRTQSNVVELFYYNSTLTYFHRTTLNDIKTSNKIALIYKNQDFKVFVNGIKQDEQLSGSTSLFTLNDLSFSGIGSEPFYGNVKQLQYFNSALDSQQLEQLTSWQSFRDMANGQLYTIE